MRKWIYCLLISFVGLNAQETPARILALAQQLDTLSVHHPEFNAPLKVSLDLTQISMADFLQSVADLHEINLTIDPTLKTRFMVAQFSTVTVKEVLLYLCKTYSLTIDFTGSILNIQPYFVPPELPSPPFVFFDLGSEKISLNFNEHSLGEAFKSITEQTPFNLLYPPSLKDIPLSFFIEESEVESALKQLAHLHKLQIEQSEDGFFLFEKIDPEQNNNFNWSSKGKMPFEILKDGAHLHIRVKSYPIGQLIEEIAKALNINWYQTVSLKPMGNIDLNIDKISFDELLPLLFENQISKAPVAGEPLFPIFDYRKKGSTYFFGLQDQISTRTMTKIILQHRSIELLGDPFREVGNATPSISGYGRQNLGQSYGNQSFGQSYGDTSGGLGNFGGRSPTIENRVPTLSNKQSSPAQKTLNTLIPNALTNGLQIQVDRELNAFFVLGSAQKVARFKNFIEQIDQPIPVILIEVMLIEVNKSAQLDTGISWGLEESETKDKGDLFPSVDAKIGASTANRILGGFSQLRALNLGKLQPNFFLQLKALEESGTVKVLSSPRMATLNGHRAVFSNSEISYYAYTSQNYYGFQNPQTSEITNYIPISAGLTLSVKPYVTGNSDVTLDVFVKQSSFNNVRIAEDAPPGIESREFSSIVRMRNKDIAILGGLEQNTKNNSGNGVPILARIPVLKWLFSQKKYSNSKRKLTVLIQPTLIE